MPASPLARGPSIPSAVGLVVANLVPLVGVVGFGWDLFEVMWLYWAENGIVGAYALLRIGSAGRGGWASVVPKLFLMPFFAVHYGLFWAVHGVFVYALFGGHRTNPIDAEEGFFTSVLTADLPAEALLAMALSHGASFAFNYLASGEWRTALANEEMFKPYGRVVVLHVVLIAGGFLLLRADGGLLALALFVVLKTALDLGIHLKAHQLRRRKHAAALASA